VAVVNSVLDAIRLEDEIVQHGFDRSSIAVIRGLSNRAVRSRAGKLIAIGTSAIEVGVDFDCDLLLFEAFEAASFLQRFGRAGRHRTGDVFMFVPSNAIKAMSSAPDIIDRSAFERLIYDCYPLSDARPWFGATELGLLTAASIPERLYQTVERDWNASEKLLSRFRDRLDAMFAEHGSALGCGKVLDRVKAKLDGYRRPVPIPNMRWYRAYVRLNRFRTSMPSVGVHDWREHNRRGEWELGSYEVDIGTLLKRVRNIRRHPTAGLLISGIGSSRRVHAGESAAHLPQGVPLLTAEIPVRLLQDGLETPISDYLS
jgi:CRISPR-associated endonuclease/helicase Cas3